MEPTPQASSRAMTRMRASSCFIRVSGLVIEEKKWLRIGRKERIKTDKNRLNDSRLCSIASRINAAS